MRNDRKQFFVWLAAVCLATGFFSAQACAQEKPRAQQNPEFKLRLGEQLPQFELTDFNGKVWRNADLKGKAVYINVWASW